MIAPPEIDEDVRLSKNFWLYEFTSPDGKPVPDELIEGLTKFTEGTIQKVRTFIGVPLIVTSGFRSRAYNDALRQNSLKRNGGISGVAQNSRHIYTENPDGVFAVDVKAPGWTPDELFRVFEGLINLGEIPDGGLHSYPEGWVHYDNGARRRWRSI